MKKEINRENKHVFWMSGKIGKRGNEDRQLEARKVGKGECGMWTGDKERLVSSKVNKGNVTK